MLRVILGSIAGFIAWSILWVGSEQALSQWISPGWFGEHQARYEKAVFNNEPFVADTTILILHIIRGALVSIMSGFIAAIIAGENRKAPLICGILVLAFGLYIAFVTWNLVPAWYNIILMGLLIPMIVLGGRLKKTA